MRSETGVRCIGLVSLALVGSIAGARRRCVYGVRERISKVPYVDEFRR